jgi:hypothetical protein
LIARDEVLHVGEHLLQFAQLVVRKLPVACIAGEPEFGVVGLDPLILFFAWSAAA